MHDHLSDVIGETRDKFTTRPQYAVPMYMRYAVRDRTGMTSLERRVTFRATVGMLSLSLSQPAPQIHTNTKRTTHTHTHTHTVSTVK